MKTQLSFPTKSGILSSFFILTCVFGLSAFKPIDLNTPLKIVLFEGKNFVYNKAEVTETLRNVKYIKKNYRASSIIVDEGTVAKVYSAAHYEGCSFTIVGPYKIPDLDVFKCGCSGTWNNEISSVELYPNSNERSPGVYGLPSSPARSYPYNTHGGIGFGNVPNWE